MGRIYRTARCRHCGERTDEETSWGMLADENPLWLITDSGVTCPKCLALKLDEGTDVGMSAEQCYECRYDCKPVRLAAA